MTEIGVKKTVARLISDESFKKEFIENPKEAVEKSGYSLTAKEIEALSKVRPQDLDLKYVRKPGHAGTAADWEVCVGSIKNFKPSVKPSATPEPINQ